MTPETAQIIAAGVGGALSAGGVVVAILKFTWSVIRLWAMRKAKTHVEKNQIADLDPKFVLPFALVAAGALAALLGHGGTILADARPRPQQERPAPTCKCPPDCAGPTCRCDKNCDCRCGARPVTPARPHISSLETLASLPYAGDVSLSASF